MSKQDSPLSLNQPYGENHSLTEIAIVTMARSIGELEYRQKGLPVPESADLLRMAKERYESSIENGPDNHLGTAKPLI